MALLEPQVSRQERIGWEAQSTAARLMGQMNLLASQLVEMMVEVIDVEAWGGGLRSPEHWLCVRAGISSHRSEGICRIARRVEELPRCIELFNAGQLTEDAMALIARKLPAERDAEIAQMAPMLLHSQLQKILRHLPDQKAQPSQRERSVRLSTGDDGWVEGRFVLPPDEGALAQKALNRPVKSSSTSATPMPTRLCVAS